MLPRQALVTIYKAFIRPHLDYGDVFYDQAFNNYFHAKMESIQYNACLAITGAIWGTSREKIYQELCLEYLQLRRWYRKLCLFDKILKNEHPKYLFHLILVRCTSYVTRTESNIPLIKTKHNFFKNSFFPSAIIECNNLYPNLRNSKSISVFKEKILNFIRPTILSPLLTFSSTVPSLLMKDALSSTLYVALIVNYWILPIMISHKRYFLETHPKL